MNLNKAILVGRLTRDPEVRALPSGQQVCSFGLATGRFFTDKSGQRQQQTEFHNIVLFGKLAEISSQYLKKGSLTMIEGRLQTRKWQDGQGNQRSRTEIVAERMQLGPRSGQSADYSKSSGGFSQAVESEKENQAAEEIPIVEEDGGEIDVSRIPF